MANSRTRFAPKKWSRWLPLAGAFSLAACSPAETPPPLAPTLPAPSASAPSTRFTGVAPGGTPEDRSPVEAPAGLIAQVHMSSPAALARALERYAPQTAGAGSSSPAARDFVVLLLGGRRGLSLERIVDTDAPADVAVVVATEGRGGGSRKGAELLASVAVGVRDDADLLIDVGENFAAEPLSGGVIGLFPRVDDADAFADSKRDGAPCVIVPALGPSKRRLVCTIDRRPRVQPARKYELAAWLARGITRRAEPQTFQGAAAAIHAEFDAVELRKHVGPLLAEVQQYARIMASRELTTGSVEIDRALKKNFQEVVDDVFDWVGDIENLAADAVFEPTGVRLVLTQSCATAKSWLARVYLRGAEVNGPIPAMFGKLPTDGVSSASFYRATSGDDALLIPVQRGALELLEAAAVDLKWSKGDRDAALAWLRLLFQRSADRVSVSGAVSSVPNNVLQLGKRDRAAADALAIPFWSVVSEDRDAKSAISVAKATAAFLQRPFIADAIRTVTRGRLTFKAAAKPGSTKDLPKGSFAQNYALQIGWTNSRPVYVGSTDSRHDGDPKHDTKSDKKPSTISLDEFIVPDGETRTWTAWGSSVPTKELVAHLNAIREGNPPSMVSAHPLYEFLSKGSATPSSGLIFFLDGFTKSIAASSPEVGAMISSLPDQGKGALALRSQATRSGDGGVGEVSVFVPRDLVSAVLTGGRRMFGLLVSTPPPIVTAHPKTAPSP